MKFQCKVIHREAAIPPGCSGAEAAGVIDADAELDKEVPCEVLQCHLCT